MNRQSDIALRGDPVAAGILALRLNASEPGLRLYVPLEDLLRAEGETFPVPSHMAGFDELVTAQWPAFLQRVDGVLEKVEQPVALVDPVQMYAALLGEGVRSLADAPDDSEAIDVPRLDPVTRPSQILQASTAMQLDLPILHEPSEDESGKRYTQVLPMDAGMVMVREREARLPLLAVQKDLLGWNLT